MCYAPEVVETRTSQSCSLLSNWFFMCEHLFTDKGMGITEPFVRSVGLLGVGTRLYHCKKLHTLNKDLN